MNRTVAFIDVLGFKQMIDSQSAEELGERYRKILFAALEKYDPLNIDIENIPTIFGELLHGDQYCIKYVFSDSIILTSHDDSELSCLKLLVFAFKLARQMFAAGFFVRGGISYGDMYVNVNDSVFVGQALTKAYQLESNQEWSGIAIDDSVCDTFPAIFDGQKEHGDYLNKLFPKYQVPMKKGPVKEYHVINWRWNLYVQEGTRSILKEQSEWAASVKIRNTLGFAFYVREKNIAYPSDHEKCPIEIRPLFVAKGPPGDKMPGHGDGF